MMILYAVLATVVAAAALSTDGVAFCGGPFTDEQGEIVSPGWPGHYPADTTCDYSIQVPEGKVVALMFHVFDTEDNVADCKYDYLQIFDGPNPSSPQIGLEKLCGDELPAEIRSTSRDLYLHFRSDHAISARGFRATYKAVDPETLTSSGCNRVFMADSGTLHSPGWPGTYPADLDCTFHIQVTDGKKVKVTFDTFDLEEGAICRYDWLQIYDGEMKDNPSTLGEPMCGSETPAPITSSGRDMTLRFASDSDVGKKGFRLTWTAVEAGFNSLGIDLRTLLEREMMYRPNV